MSSSPAANTLRLWSLASSRALQIFAAATILSLVVAAAMGAGGFPFDRPAVGTTDRAQNIILQVLGIVSALVLIALAFWLTRKRAAVDFDSRTPEKAVAKWEALWLLIYGTAVLFVGGLLGVGMHLHGAIFGPTQDVVPRELYLVGWLQLSLLCHHSLLDLSAPRLRSPRNVSKV